MNLLTNRIILKKTGLLLLVILFFLGCKKEKNEIGIEDPARLPTSTHFTDTLTIRSEVVLIDSSINTTNVSSNDTNSLFLVGAYTDPKLGSMAVEAYTRIKLVKENIELPAATPDSAFIQLHYSYYYGDSTKLQTINVYKLTEPIRQNKEYYTRSAGLTYDPTPIGFITFYAKIGTSKVLKIPITDVSFLQSILDASKNNNSFHDQIPGLAFIPSNNIDGSIIRVDASSSATSFKIHYTQYAEQKVYNLTIGRPARKFYRIISDRSSSVLASLNSTYSSLSTTLTGNQCFVQSCSGIRTRITIPYLHKLKEAYPNMTIISASLVLRAATGSEPVKYRPNTGLVLMRTEKTEGTYKIKKDSKGTVFYVQPDDQSQILNQSVQIHNPLEGNKYYFPIRSYLQAIVLGQVENDPIIISPSLLYREANRLVFNDNTASDKAMKVKIYFTTTK